MRRPEPLNETAATAAYNELKANGPVGAASAGNLLALARISQQLDYIAQLLEEQR